MSVDFGEDTGPPGATVDAPPVRLSLVIPVFNEERSIAPFLERCDQVLPEALARLPTGSSAEFVFVDDGSTDATAAVLTGRAGLDDRVKLVRLSRNFGKEAALAAGLAHSTGDAVIPIDVDLQDPPEVIIPMLEAWLGGAQVVNAKRLDRSSDTWPKRSAARVFYWLYNRLADYPIPANVGDFRLIDRQAVEVIRLLSEQARFNKGLFSWVGFTQATVEYERAPRAVGRTKWANGRLFGLAVDGIVSSSTFPLRVWSYLGALIAAGAFSYALFVIIYTLTTGGDTPGFASIMVAVTLLGGLNMVALGVLGAYVGRIANEVRQRPLYVVAATVGVERVVTVA